MSARCNTADVRPCALYRHFDAAGALLYVGISNSPVARLEHHGASAWVGLIARIDIERHPSRSAALAAEVVAISDEKPSFNSQHGELSKGANPRKFAGRDNSELLAEINAHLSITGEPRAAFSLRAVGDKSFLKRLELGTEPRAATVAKVRASLTAVQA